MEYLIYLTIFSGLFGQLIKLPFGSGNFYPQDILVIIVGVVFVFDRLLSNDKKIDLPGFWPFLFFFCFWALISLIHGARDLPPSDFIDGAAYLIRFAAYAFLALVVFDLKRSSPKFFGRVLWALIISGLVLAVAGFVQLIVYPDLARLAAEFGYDPHKNRLVSTFLDPNFTAAYLVLSLTLLLCMSERVSDRFTTLLHSNVVRAFLGTVLVLAIFLTFSRSGWLLLAAVLFLYSLLRSPRLIFLAGIIGFLAYFAVPRVQTRLAGITDPNDSAQLRLVSWSHALAVWRSSPIAGVGFNLYRTSQEDFGFFGPRLNSTLVVGGHAGAGSDSSLLLVLATTGVVGLILFLLLALRILFLSTSNIRAPAGLAITLSLFGLLFESQFINSLFFPQIMLWLWILLGLL
ncbi:MAG: O-antigen ligase family protein [Patescibacteria group bacterium]|nr:O-antigen ligase family protein [Patescibacteria group bacterium]